MKTFITKLRLPAKPVGKPVKIVRPYDEWDVWGEPIIYSIDHATGQVQYASFENFTHSAQAIGASMQGVSHALQQATASAREMSDSFNQLQQLTWIDDSVREAIYNQAQDSALSTSDIITNLINERLIGYL